MARNMHIGDRLVVDLRSLAEEIIDRAIHHALIAWYWSRRKNHCITRLDANQAMILVCNASQRRRGLTLATRTYNHHLVRAKLFDVLASYQHALRHMQITQLQSHLHIINYAAANQGHVTIIAFGGINYLLHTRKQ